MGLVISLTGIARQERLQIERLVVENGGTFQHSMDIDKCTHLIADRPEGEKYKSVEKKIDIRIMKREWIYDCVSGQGTV